MLTISQLASYAGVTVRAVRHYHQKGLFPEPERDWSGYRRYDAQAVVELIRIRTLADAGVPLSRVKELLDAGEADFAAAVTEIDGRLRDEIAALQRHRRNIAQLTAGDGLALPPEVTGYLTRMRELGFSERIIAIERDSWILLAAQMPEQTPVYMAIKHAQIGDPQLRELYLDIGAIVDAPPDDPRLPGYVDRVVAFIEAAAAKAGDLPFDPDDEQFVLEPALIELLDSAFVAHFPSGRRILELLEERGWTGWTDIRRIEDPSPA